MKRSSVAVFAAVILAVLIQAARAFAAGDPIQVRGGPWMLAGELMRA